MLIAGSDNNPLFQFNRSSLRVKWFKDTYPSSVNMYLLREPRGNFMSYEEYLSKDNPFFTAMDMVIINYNLSQPVFKWLRDYIDLKIIDSSIEESIRECSDIVRTLSSEDRYLMFYTIWYTSLVFNSIHADIIIDMNKLSDNLPYNNSVITQLSSYGINGVTFEDAKLGNHSVCTLPKSTMRVVESLVQVNINKVINYE